MIKKIVFIVESIFTIRDYDRFGIDILINNGFQVQILDLTTYLMQRSALPTPTKGPVKFNGYTAVKNKIELNAILKLHTNDWFIIPIIPYRPETYFIYKYISKYNIPYGFFSSAVPYGNSSSSKKLNLLKKVINRFFTLNLYNFKSYLIYHLPCKLLGLKPAKYIFASGAACSCKFKLSGKGTEIVWIHAFDYDNYLANKSKKTRSGNYAVFLDQNLPFHSDFVRQGKLNPFEPNDYYSELTSAFDRIEKEFGLVIIIAAHPDGEKEILSKFFKGREVIFGDMENLVKGSNFCITHWSFSLNMAVLYKKPIILLTSSSIKKSNHEWMLQSYSSKLGISPVNISSDMAFTKEKTLSASEYRYKNYKHNFIKKDNSPEIPYWDVVSSLLLGRNLD
jgi:hypothetical protein